MIVCVFVHNITLGTQWNVNLFMFLIHAHQKYATSYMYYPWQHGPYTRLSRPLLSACVKGGWARDYTSSMPLCFQRDLDFCEGLLCTDDFINTSYNYEKLDHMPSSCIMVHMVKGSLNHIDVGASIDITEMESETNSRPRY